jgi:hypothetical protein
VDREGLAGRLASTRYLLETAAVRLAEIAKGEDHPRIDDARDRLQAACAAVTNAAGGLSMWTRTWLGLAVLGGASWAAAALTGQLIGLSAGWTILVTVAVVLGLVWPAYTLMNVLARRINRWRTRPPELTPKMTAPVAVTGTAEVLGLLNMARDSLALAIRQRSAACGYPVNTAAGFDWSRGRDLPLFWISLADRRLCQVIYSIELWLTVLADEQ